MKKTKIYAVLVCGFFIISLITGCGHPHVQVDFTPLPIETSTFLDIQWGMSPKETVVLLGGDMEDIILTAKPTSSTENASLCYTYMTLKNQKILDYDADIELCFANTYPNQESIGLAAYKITFSVPDLKNQDEMMQLCNEKGFKIGSGIQNPAGTTIDDLPEDLQNDTREFLKIYMGDITFSDVSMIWGDYSKDHTQIIIRGNGVVAAVATYIQNQ